MSVASSRPIVKSDSKAAIIAKRPWTVPATPPARYQAGLRGLRATIAR